jgi:hypothetical protein
MKFTPASQPRSSRRRRIRTLGALSTACVATLALIAGVVFAAQPPVGLGTSSSFAVLSGQAVTNTGPSTINGNLGVSPGTAVTGFPPGTVNGTIHSADAVAAQAQLDLTTAYNDAAGRTPAVAVPADLTGLTLTPGVYQNSSALGLTGAVTLNAQGNPNAVFIFQAGSTLITGSGSTVNLINGAQPCNVFWQVGSSATLGTTTTFVGNIMALSSISMNNGVTLTGRALARNGSVTMINDTVNAPTCATGTTVGTGGTGATGTAGGGGGGGATRGAGGSGAIGRASFVKPPGSIIASGINRCVNQAFRATVRGHLIKKVQFSVGGHVIATRKASPFSASVQPGVGVQEVHAHVTFTGTTKAKNLTLHFRACSAASGTSGFTG